MAMLKVARQGSPNFVVSIGPIINEKPYRRREQYLGYAQGKGDLFESWLKGKRSKYICLFS